MRKHPASHLMITHFCLQEAFSSGGRYSLFLLASWWEGLCFRAHSLRGEIVLRGLASSCSWVILYAPFPWLLALLSPSPSDQPSAVSVQETRDCGLACWRKAVLGKPKNFFFHKLNYFIAALLSVPGILPAVTGLLFRGHLCVLAPTVSC